jgi:hypothetical protein
MAREDLGHRLDRSNADPAPMWIVTTTGHLPADDEECGHETPLSAWSDYHGRILELRNPRVRARG